MFITYAFRKAKEKILPTFLADKKNYTIWIFFHSKTVFFCTAINFGSGQI